MEKDRKLIELEATEINNSGNINKSSTITHKTEARKDVYISYDKFT